MRNLDIVVFARTKWYNISTITTKKKEGGYNGLRKKDKRKIE